MYRILAASGEVHERRDQRRHLRLCPAGAPRERTERTVVVGYHEAAGPGQVDLLPALRDPRRLFPLRHRLDGRHPGERGPRRAAHRRLGPKAGDRAGQPDHPCRPGQLDDVAAGRAPARRSRDRQEPFPAPHEQRQSVLRGRLQDPGSTAPSSPIGSARSKVPGPSARASSPGTTRSTATAGLRCSPQPTSITAGRARCSKSEPASSPAPT
jgi:hypothetical protein